MRADFLNQIARRAERDGSDGIWASIDLPEAAQCLVCRRAMLPGERVMASPGRWVRHPDCKWPAQALGVETGQRSAID